VQIYYDCRYLQGKIINRGPKKINLRGGWIVVPFSRGVHTQYEGEWWGLFQIRGYVVCAVPKNK
jgi:hypothetical protein